jgi:transposase
MLRHVVYASLLHFEVETAKHFRAIATRYEKTARNFLAGLHLVCTLAWLK